MPGRCRKHVLLVGLLTALVAPSVRAEPAPAALAEGDSAQQAEETIARHAFVWGYPLVRAAQLRQRLTQPDDPLVARPASSPGAPINRFGHAHELGSPRMRQGVAPNNDTLYSLAWLDLHDGPFVMTTPDFGARYYVFQMGQADSSTAQALGRRTHGRHLPPLFIQGPGQRWPVPRGMVGVRSTQRYLMIAGRILVDGAQDVASVARLQQQIRLRRYADWRAGRDVLPPIPTQRPVSESNVEKDAAAFLADLGAVLQDWRPAPGERALVRSFARIGLTLGKGYRADTVPPTVRSAVLRGIAAAQAEVRAKTFALSRNVHGWSINLAGSEFGGDSLLRAAVAMDQIYVLPREEALYPNARQDGAGRTLDGRQDYVLRFPAGQTPPMRFFWSATMYHAEGLMVDNEIGRYAIGDRTPGLRRDADGGLTLYFQHQAPETAAARANWLPTPAGPFMLMLRLYGPLAPALSGSWTPPPIERNDPRRQAIARP